MRTFPSGDRVVSFSLATTESWRDKGTGERKLVIFSDADCPFCARLEQELKSVDNVTIYTFLYPIDSLHPDAARKSRMIWCSADKVKAYEEDGNRDVRQAAYKALIMIEGY